MLTSAGLRGEAGKLRKASGANLSKPIRRSDLLNAISLLLFPVEEVQARESLPKTKLTQASHAALTILLAEDDFVNQLLATALLEKRGHTVVLAKNGKEALAALEKQSFDLVLMDVQMPEMGGLEATKAIRQKEKISGEHLPIIALTANAVTGDRERFLLAGMDGYVSKPISVQELFAAIEAAPLEQREAARLQLQD
jgi:CheY-like chemotaxis protein